MLNTPQKILIGIGFALSASFAYANDVDVVDGSSFTKKERITEPAPAMPDMEEFEVDDNPLSTPELFEVLKNTENHKAQVSATYALSLRAMKSTTLRQQVITAFIEQMPRDTNASARWMKTSWLNRLAEKSDAATAIKIGEFLNNIATTDPDAEVRASAASGLAELAEKHKALVKSAMLTLMTLILGDKADAVGDVRHKAIRGVAWISLRYPALAETGFTLLHDCAKNEKDAAARWQCIKSLSWIGEQYATYSQKSLDRLIETLNSDPDRDNRVEAISGIGRISRKFSALSSTGKSALLVMAQKNGEFPDVIAYAKDMAETIREKAAPPKPSP